MLPAFALERRSDTTELGRFAPRCAAFASMMAPPVAIDDGALWCDVVGGSNPSAPPIIALHGGLGLDHTTLRPWLDPLTKYASAFVYYDHRGNGRSREPADWASIDHATFTADTETIRHHLVASGLPASKVLLFGHSYGGFIALEYAIRYPDRVAGLILCTTGPALQHGELLLENARARGTDEQMAALLGLFGGPTSDDAALATGMRAIAPLYFHAPTSSLCDAVFGGVQYRAGASNHALFSLAPAYDVRGRLGELTRRGVPVLLIGGADDWIMPARVGLDALLAELPNATRVEVPESGHFPFAEEPTAFRAVVAAWFANVYTATQ